MNKSNTKENTNSKQDKIFRKMSAEEKFKLASELTMFCFKLNKLNGNHRTRKIAS
jgi:hypothetical protein